MTQDVQVIGFGDIRPGWMKKLDEALDEAARAGWNLNQDVVLQGHPYVWEGEPRMATWTASASRQAKEVL